MVSPTQMARVYVYDIADVISALSPTFPQAVELGRMRVDDLIDAFIDNALDSFQYLGVENHLIRHVPVEVREWINQQTHSVELLWHKFSVEEQYAGREAFVVRRNHKIWLFVLV